MKLVYRIALTFIFPLVVTLGLWGWLSYRTMERKIMADTDLILRDYAHDIIMRYLSGKPLPDRFNGAYNTYLIEEVTPETAESGPTVEYSESEAYLQSQEDFASSRVRRQIFRDSEGHYFRLTVSLPTFERDVLVEHVLSWTVVLFFALMVALLIIGVLVLKYNFRPFYRLLEWMEEYQPGKPGNPVPSDTDIIEFRSLAHTVREAVERFEREYEDRKIFIGNVSHEIQTPLAVCANRVEMLLDRPDLGEEMADELVKLHRSLQHLIRLNKTLLLLTKIENGQFPEIGPVNLGGMLGAAIDMYDDIYAHKALSSSMETEGELVCRMNEQMASVLVNNLMKNAYVHSPDGSDVTVHVDGCGFSVSNSGISPLDRSKIFSRFYLPGGRKDGSTGLGLALAYSVCGRSGLELTYDFVGSRHVFTVSLKKSK